MRTTVEITEEQHQALSALAQRRGLRGFSMLVQEALDAYLHDLGTDETDLLLGLTWAVADTYATWCATVGRNLFDGPEEAFGWWTETPEYLRRWDQ